MDYTSILSKAYKGKKVFLSGHTGFKGSWLLLWLHELGANIKGYSLSPRNEEDHYNLINGDALCESVIGDIRDKNKLIAEITSFQPDYIFHLAAQPLVRHSYEQPLYTFEVNVNGTAHILEALRELKNQCQVVIVTTDKVYFNKEEDYHYKEDDKLGGYDPYSASKAAAEIITSSYRDSFFHPADFANHKKAVASARAGNVIGGGDWATDRIIPDIIRALRKNIPVVVRNPASVRPWQHVLEPLSGYLLLGAKLSESPSLYSGSWNFGPEDDDTSTVLELVEQAIKANGSGDYLTPQMDKQPHEAGLLKLDSSKAKSKLQWSPRLNSTAAIERTMEWYAHTSKGSAKEFSIQQIIDYATSQ